MSRLIVPAAAVLCLAGYVFVYGTGRATSPIRSDGFSYYVYLPSWFIYHDTTLSAVAADCCGGVFPEYTAIIRWPGTRRWVNAHPIGVATLQAPFFLAAHALTLWSNLSPDGFTLYYQHAAGLAGLAWVVAGLWVLRNYLQRYFSRHTTAATLVVLLLGTNLYHYATYDSSYSHPYSFFLFTAFLDLTDRWHRTPTRALSICIGVVSGLIVLTRHTNVLFLAALPLYGVSLPSWRDALKRLDDRGREIATVTAVCAVVVVPQLAIYYQATGSVLVSSYGQLGFNFSEPRLFGVLFSVQKGVFFWAPILLVAVAGLMLPHPASRAIRWPAAVFLTLNTYLIASWWDWQFGGSFGHRGFVDALPLFAVGLAAVFERTARHVVSRGCMIVLATAAVALSIVQMLQYWNGVLPISDTTWDQYRSLFLRLR